MTDEDRGGWRLLRHRSFATYWVSGLFSNVGTWVHNVTAGVVVYQLTSSPFMVGVVAAATFAPVLLLSLPAGVLADRLDRKRLVVGLLSCSAVVSALLVVLAAAGGLSPWVLVTACAVIGANYAVVKPALTAMLPELVPPRLVVSAAAVNTLQFNLGQVIGPLAATGILLALSPAWAFAANTASFLVQVVGICLLPRATRGGLRRKVSGASGGVVEGLRYMRSTPPMPILIGALVVTNGASEALRTLAPAVASTVLVQDPALGGALVTSFSVGTVVGVLLFQPIHRWLSGFACIPLSFALQATGALGVALSGRSLVAVMASAAVIGLGTSINVPMIAGSLQELSLEALRGRVQSVYSMAHLGCRPVFALVAGGMAAVVGVRATFVGISALALVAALVGGRLVIRTRSHDP